VRLEGYSELPILRDCLSHESNEPSPSQPATMSDCRATLRAMTYDLAVFEGDPPADDRAGAAEFRRLYETFMNSDVATSPTDRIAAYAMALLVRYPDIDTDAGVDSPWSSGPLLGEASGPLMSFPMVWSRCEEVSAWAAQLAADHGLNCYDPQQEPATNAGVSGLAVRADVG
jgi:hypothetical protein